MSQLTSVLPPHSEPIERIVLANMMTDNDTALLFCSRLTADDFYIETHKLIFGALVECAPNTDLPTVQAVLVKNGNADLVNGVVELLTEASYLSDANFFISELREFTQRRKLLIALSKVATAAYDATVTHDTLVDIAIKEVTSSIVDSTKRKTMNDVAESALVDFEERIAANGAPRGIVINLKDVDVLTSGFQRGRLYTFAGRPGSGKSVLLAQAACEAARQGKRVLYFSLEMGAREIYTRMAKYIARVGYSDGEEFDLDDALRDRVRKGISDLRSMPLKIYDDVSSIAQIIAECQLQATRGVDMIVIDYIQLAVADTSKRDLSTRDLEISTMTRSLKQAALRLDVPTLIGSQLNRQADGVCPTLAMMRESGGIENDSDVVVALWNAPQPFDEIEVRNASDFTNLTILKNRAGRVGEVVLYFHKSQHRFGLTKIERPQIQGVK